MGAQDEFPQVLRINAPVSIIRKQLRRDFTEKLAEYRARLGHDAQWPYGDQRDTLHKIVIVERLLERGQLNTDTLRAELVVALGTNFDLHIYINAVEVVFHYINQRSASHYLSPAPGLAINALRWKIRRQHFSASNGKRRILTSPGTMRVRGLLNFSHTSQPPPHTEGSYPSTHTKSVRRSVLRTQ